MVSSPKVGQRVQCWYKDRTMTLHGRFGIVVIVSRGKPRNHGVEINGTVYVVPAGNLRPPPSPAPDETPPRRNT